MQIHPLTRFVTSPESPGGYILEVRIEFHDEWNHPTKAIGTLSVELRDVSGELPTLYGNVDLSDLAINARQFEPVTQSYLLRIDPSWDAPPRPASTMRLRALMLTPDHEQMQHSIELLWP